MELLPSEPDVDVTVGRDGTYHVWHDPWDDDVCVTITQALAAIDDADEAIVGRAFTENIDPDSLNRLFQPNNGMNLGSHRDRVTFELEDHVITINADGLVEIDL